MASTGDESKAPPAKRARHDDAQAAPARVQLNPADCNLDFVVDHGGLRGHALHGGGFAYCWSGARATAGIRGGGRYCFGCRVVAEQPVEMEDTDAGQRHPCRVGISRGDDPVGSLGEAGGHSFAFGGTGKLCHDGNLTDYGAKFGVGDTIVCAVDLDSRPMASIRFSKNGEWLGVAHSFDASEKGFGLVDAPVRPMPWESAIFPHVLLKNVVVDMQFSMEDGLEPVNGYQPWSSVLADGNAVLGPLLTDQKECEVLMMVGLPASGKTTWADKLVKEHRQKRFVILGINLALEQMKMTGLLSQKKIADHFDRWVNRATTVVDGLLRIAANVHRNYILDQTNHERIVRVRLLSRFSDFGRKIAVVVFPSPAELKSRSRKRFLQTWKEVPDEVVNKMSANFALPLSKNMPGSMETFDEVIFVELSRDDAQRYLNPMRSNHGSNASYQDASARGWRSTSHNQMQWRSNVSDKQSSSNAPTEPSSSNAPAEKDKQVDSDLILSKKLELGQEYEEMDTEYNNIRKMSRSGQALEASDAAWDAFEARLDKCRAMQREIRNAKGDPQPIPEWFLLGRDFVLLKNLELEEELKSLVKSRKEVIAMSGRGHASAAEMESAWAAFKGRHNKCRAIQREIREARGVPLPMPEEFSDY